MQKFQTGAIEPGHAIAHAGDVLGLRYRMAEEGWDAWGTNKPILIQLQEFEHRE
jgi:hypothetical protein